MSTKFTNTIEAVLQGDRHQWLGDALKKDFSDGSSGEPEKGGFQECSRQLKELGYPEYTSDYLRRLYVTAKLFTGHDRNPHWPWWAHCIAGTPDNLTKAADALCKLKKSVSQENVQWIMNEWRAKALKEREGKLSEAKEVIEETKGQITKAKERKLGQKIKPRGRRSRKRSINSTSARRSRPNKGGRTLHLPSSMPMSIPTCMMSARRGLWFWSCR
jgi:hypothetical protein